MPRLTAPTRAFSRGEALRALLANRRRARARGRAAPAMSTALARSTWPTASVSPGAMKLRRRSSSGVRPAAAATSSMCRSSANMLCGAPKPRNAPCGGVLVATARPRTRTFGQRYGPGRVNRAARQHDRRQRAVGAAVDREVDVHREQPAVARHRRAMAGARRDGAWSSPPCLRRGRRSSSPAARLPARAAPRAPAIIDGYSSLPPKPPPVSVWTTRIFSRRQAEQPGERLVDVVRALHRAPDGDAVLVVGDGAACRWLDVELLLRAGLVLAFDDDGGGGEGGVDVRLSRRCSDLKMLSSPQTISRRARASSMLEHRRQRLDSMVDVLARVARAGARSRCAISTTGSSGWLTTVVREVRLVVGDQRRRRLRPGMSAAVTTTNSSQGTTGSKRMPVMRPRGTGTADGDAVQHARRRHVVDIDAPRR